LADDEGVIRYLEHIQGQARPQPYLLIYGLTSELQVAAKEDELKTVLDLERETVERQRQTRHTHSNSHGASSTSLARGSHSPHADSDGRYFEVARARRQRIQEQNGAIIAREDANVLARARAMLVERKGKGLPSS